MSSRSWWRDPFVLLVLLIVAGLASLYLYRIGSDPPSLYDDEASIGYNAWTIAHYGTDQYGNHFPLFFTDFGDYKGPIATYLVAPFTWVFVNGATVARLPSVLAGIAIFLIAGRLALLLTGSRGVAVVTMVLTALQPWIFLQSHTMMEGNVLMVLSATLACWFIAEASVAGAAPRWWSAAGVALGICVYTYAVGRLLAVVVASVATLSYARIGRDRILRFLFPVAIAYVVLGVWSLKNPGALLARFQSVGLFADHPSATVAVGRFASNYASYLSPDFLILKGDGNLRQTTGFGGVLLDATLPLMVVGAIRLLKRWREPFPRFILLGTVVAPVPAVLTLAAPHALRGAGLIPFLIVMMAEGTAWIWTLLRSHRVTAIALAAVVVASATPYFVDFFTAYPARAAVAFQAGEGEALRMAYLLTENGRHRLFLSASLNQPAMQLMYAVNAPPPQDDFIRRARITVVTSLAQLGAEQPGDVVVFGSGDSPPMGARLLFAVRDGQIVLAPTTLANADLLRVYQV